MGWGPTLACLLAVVTIGIIEGTSAGVRGPQSINNCFTVTASPADGALTQLFALPKSGLSGDFGQTPQTSPLTWMGGDCDASFRLDATNYLWIFGDTLLGTFNNQRDVRELSGIQMPHQSVATVTVTPNGDPSGSQHFWRASSPGSGKVKSLFTPVGQSNPDYYCRTVPAVKGGITCDYLWVLTGARVGAGNIGLPGPALGPVVLLAATIYPTVGGFGFGISGTAAIAVDNPSAPPSAWNYRIANLTNTGPAPNTGIGQINWSTTITFANDSSNPDLVYIVGETLAGSVLLRTNLSSFASSLSLDGAEYWVKAPHLDGSRQLPPNCALSGAIVACWNATLRSPADLQPAGIPATSETTLNWSPSLQMWYVPLVDGWELQLHTAPAVTGPWTTTTIYTIPKVLSSQFCYAAKAHEELQRGGVDELVVSYVCNTLSFGALFNNTIGTDVYTPQFVRISIDKLCTNSFPTIPNRQCGTRCITIAMGICIPVLLLCVLGVAVYGRRRWSHSQKSQWQREEILLQTGSPRSEVLYRGV